MVSNSLRAWLAAAAVLVPVTALAQPAPGDTSLDQRVQAVSRLPDAAAQAQEAILTGRNDIVLMRERQFFTLSASASAFHATNAALGSDARSDQFVTADVTLRAGTTLGGRVDVYAEIGGATAQYRQFSNLGYVAAQGAIGAHTTLYGLDVDAAYAPSVIFDREAKSRQLTQHRFVVTVGRGWATREGASLRVAASIERISADPSPYTNSGAAISASAAVPLNRERSLNGFVAMTGVYRSYDNYFEDFVGVARRDRLLELSVGLGWTPTERISLDLRWTQSRNWSTSDVNRYRAGVGGLGLRAAARF